MAFLGLGKKDEELPASFGVGAATDERLVPRGVVVARVRGRLEMLLVVVVKNEVPRKSPATLQPWMAPWRYGGMTGAR